MFNEQKYFLPYQLAWIHDRRPLLIGEKSRRIGWTYASSFRAVYRRLSGLGNLYFSSTDLTASREFIDYCKQWCEVLNAAAEESEEPGAIGDEQMTRLVLRFKNGKKIMAGSSNPKFFRSKGGDADADEFAFHEDGRELFKAMHATALPWGHQLRLWSTHHGPGSYFNRLISSTREGHGRIGVVRTTVLDAVDQGLVERIRKLKVRDEKARQEWLDEMRGSCPDPETWNEEYLCLPAAENTAFLSYEVIHEALTHGLRLARSPDELPAGGALYAGYDLGRKHDLSVLWVMERVGDVYWTRMLRVLEGESFGAQESLLGELMRQRAVQRLCIDETGLGMQLAERLEER